MLSKTEYVWLTVILVTLVLVLAGTKQAVEKYHIRAAEAEKVRLLQEAEAEKARLLEEEKQRVAARNLKVLSQAYYLAFEQVRRNMQAV